MAPRKNCAAGPAKFLVLLGVIRGLPLSGGEIRAFRAKKRQLLRISPGAVRRTVARSCGKELRQERPLGCALCRIAATYLGIARPTLSISACYLSTIEPFHPTALGFDRQMADCSGLSGAAKEAA